MHDFQPLREEPLDKPTAGLTGIGLNPLLHGSGTNSSSLLNRLIEEGIFTDFIPLLPAPLISVPKVPKGRSHRIRARWLRARSKVLVANEMLRVLNSLDNGHRARRTRRLQPTTIPSTTLLHRRLMEHAATAVKVRRDLSQSDCSGAQAAAALLKSDRKDRYSFERRVVNQVERWLHSWLNRQSTRPS